LISLASPRFDQHMAAALIDEILLDGRPGQGPLVEQFEREFAIFVGAKHAVACNSGTMALTIGLSALQMGHPSRTEVIIPALTFPATANAVVHAGLEPVFVDVGDDLQMDMTLIEEALSPFTLCIMPVHLLGRSADLSEILSKHIVCEDACEALGTKLDGRQVGTFGLFGAFSFFPTHTMTTGEGGMLVTASEEFAEVCRSLRDHGKTGRRDDPTYVGAGYNGKMSQLQAAFGLASLARLDEELAAREAVWGECLHGYPTVFQSELQRDAALLRLAEQGVEARAMFPCLPELPHFSSAVFIGTGKAAKLSRQALYLPAHGDISKKDADWMIEICDATTRSLVGL